MTVAKAEPSVQVGVLMGPREPSAGAVSMAKERGQSPSTSVAERAMVTGLVIVTNSEVASGASFTQVTVMFTVAVLLFEVPS